MGEIIDVEHAQSKKVIKIYYGRGEQTWGLIFKEERVQ